VSLDLSVVIPAYNEAAAIRGVIEAWAGELDRLGVEYEIRVYDDGSADATPTVLRETAAALPRLVVVRHTNRGHGPTVLRGYHEARGEWVFQTDGDGEASPADFARLWSARDAYDILVGNRVTRHAPFARRCVTVGCRLAMRLLFGTRIVDANCPYRLIRRTSLVAMLRALPDETFAPNAVLSGLAARRGLRIFETPVAWEARRTGTVSIFGWRLWKGAIRSLRQSVVIARGHRSAQP
jgi:dolichol-phosphate mannosyltransferase